MQFRLLRSSFGILFQLVKFRFSGLTPCVGAPALNIRARLLSVQQLKDPDGQRDTAPVGCPGVEREPKSPGRPPRCKYTVDERHP